MFSLLLVCLSVWTDLHKTWGWARRGLRTIPFVFDGSGPDLEQF